MIYYGLWRTDRKIHKKEGSNKIFFYCFCACGKEKLVEKFILTSGRSTSCGCGRRRKIGDIINDLEIISSL